MVQSMYRIPPNCSTGYSDQFLMGAVIKNMQTANFIKYFGGKYYVQTSMFRGLVKVSPFNKEFITCFKVKKRGGFHNK